MNDVLIHHKGMIFKLVLLKKKIIDQKAFFETFLRLKTKDSRNDSKSELHISFVTPGKMQEVFFFLQTSFDDVSLYGTEQVHYASLEFSCNHR